MYHCKIQYHYQKENATVGIGRIIIGYDYSAKIICLNINAVLNTKN